MDLRHLEYIVSVSEENNISRAAFCCGAKLFI